MIPPVAVAASLRLMEADGGVAIARPPDPIGCLDEADDDNSSDDAAACPPPKAAAVPALRTLDAVLPLLLESARVDARNAAAADAAGLAEAVVPLLLLPLGSLRVDARYAAAAADAVAGFAAVLLMLVILLGSVRVEARYAAAAFAAAAADEDDEDSRTRVASCSRLDADSSSEESRRMLPPPPAAAAVVVVAACPGFGCSDRADEAIELRKAPLLLEDQDASLSSCCCRSLRVRSSRDDSLASLGDDSLESLDDSLDSPRR
jgi:hypothetical protein